MMDKGIPLDSAEGITILVGWARAGGFVLHLYYRDLADKYGVVVVGIVLSDPIPRAHGRYRNTDNGGRPINPRRRPTARDSSLS